MAQAGRAAPSRSVFIGNIPWDATEDQLRQICEEVGPIVSLRMVLDKETKKPKGFAFAEYLDEETAESARRNLQGYEINGRFLRVGEPTADKAGDKKQQEALRLPAELADPGPPLGIPAAVAAASSMAAALGGAQGGSGAVEGDPLVGSMAPMGQQQLFAVLAAMKAMIQQNPSQARQILMAKPELTKSLFFAQISLGMVKPAPAEPPPAPTSVLATAAPFSPTPPPPALPPRPPPSALQSPLPSALPSHPPASVPRPPPGPPPLPAAAAVPQWAPAPPLPPGLPLSGTPHAVPLRAPAPPPGPPPVPSQQQHQVQVYTSGAAPAGPFALQPPLPAPPMPPPPAGPPPQGLPNPHAGVPNGVSPPGFPSLHSSARGQQLQPQAGASTGPQGVLIPPNLPPNMVAIYTHLLSISEAEVDALPADAQALARNIRQSSRNQFAA